MFEFPEPGPKLSTKVTSKTEHYHQEAVSVPNWLPTRWTSWDAAGLTMCGNNRPRRLTDGTPTDEGLYRRGTDRHHRNLYVCCEPVTVVISRGVVALFIDVTEQVRHRGETPQARARGTEVLAVRGIMTLDIQQTIASPKSCQIQWAVGY